MSRRVLLIDDDADIRAVARVAIEVADGWTVVTAPDGDTGARLAADGGFDAVIVDVMMPGLDGKATVSRLREQPASRELPVVLLTATPQAVDWEDELDVAGVLQKPFDAVRLASDIARICGWPTPQA